jgi:3-phenylpropionate/cinnamic acid dioxygenase small subunit
MSIQQMAELDRAAKPAFGPQLQWDVEQFLYREAALLDAQDYDPWLALFTPDVHYFMPVTTDKLRQHNRRQTSGDGNVMIFDEDYGALEIRVRRFNLPTCWSEQPLTRSRRIIGNVIIGAGANANELRVESKFVITLSRQDNPAEFFSGVREDILRREDGGSWRIASRKIVGDQSVLPMSATTVFF